MGKSEKSALMTANRVLQEVRKIDPEMTTQMAHCLLLVAIEPGITMKRLSEQLRMSQSSTSRNIAALGKVHRYGKPGYDLLRAEEDPGERRRKIVYLTSKGEKVRNAIIDVLSGA